MCSDMDWDTLLMSTNFATFFFISTMKKSNLCSSKLSLHSLTWITSLLAPPTTQLQISSMHSSHIYSQKLDCCSLRSHRLQTFCYREKSLWQKSQWWQLATLLPPENPEHSCFKLIKIPLPVSPSHLDSKLSSASPPIRAHMTSSNTYLSPLRNSGWPKSSSGIPTYRK